MWRSRKLRQYLVAGLFVAPALVIYSVFIIYPLATSLWGAFLEWKGIRELDFVGLENFKRLFAPPLLARLNGAFVHNVMWFLGIMIVQNSIGLLFAYVIYRRGARLEFFKTLFFIPAVLSPILVGALWRILLSPAGPLSSLLQASGFVKEPITWLSDPKLALWILILVDSWNWIGLPLLVFLAAFNDIPKEIVEAAYLEGARSFRLLFSITLPLIMQSLTLIAVLTFINSFNQFDLVYVMQGVSGSPNYSTDTLATFFYRLAFGSQGASGLTDIGAALALAGLLFVFLLLGSAAGLRGLGNRVVRF